MRSRGGPSVLIDMLNESHARAIGALTNIASAIAPTISRRRLVKNPQNLRVTMSYSPVSGLTSVGCGALRQEWRASVTVVTNENTAEHDSGVIWKSEIPRHFRSLFPPLALPSSGSDGRSIPTSRPLSQAHPAPARPVFSCYLPPTIRIVFGPVHRRVRRGCHARTIADNGC